MALDTSPDSPAPLRTVSAAIGGWIGRLGAVWVEAQIAQLTVRQDRVWLVLRDTHVDMSVPASCSRRLLDALAAPVTEGAQVIVHARPSWYDRRGSLSLYVDQIRPVGLGELLARLEQRRRLLAAEGLFGPERKRPLPFLPRCVGLVTGRDSAAERDVLEVARRRWPGVQFRVEHTLVQGSGAALQVIEALRRLDDDPEVEVIVVARGGGSVEDLLPFSDEGLVRVVAAVRTPLVSAIGHEPDSPILDLVADVRAATPTDAAKLVVPDVAEETARVRQARERVRRAVRQRVAHETQTLATLRSRPALGAPRDGLAERGQARRGAARARPPYPHPPARPGRRRHRPPGRPGPRAVAAGHAAARLRGRPGRRRARADRHRLRRCRRPADRAAARRAAVGAHRDRDPRPRTRRRRMSEQSPELSYEQARDELVDVVRRLEEGGTTLEESLTLWERGEELARVCERWLEGARARLDAARPDAGDGADEGEGAAG